MVQTRVDPVEVVLQITHWMPKGSGPLAICFKICLKPSESFLHNHMLLFVSEGSEDPMESNKWRDPRVVFRRFVVPALTFADK
jgi:hypothetical protein